MNKITLAQDSRNDRRHHVHLTPPLWCSAAVGSLLRVQSAPLEKQNGLNPLITTEVAFAFCRNNSVETLSWCFEEGKSVARGRDGRPRPPKGASRYDVSKIFGFVDHLLLSAFVV